VEEHPTLQDDTVAVAAGGAADASAALAAPAALRVGVVHYLNSWPLAWAFLRGGPLAGVEPVYLAPSQVAAGLASGELAAGLLPSAELQRIPGLAVVPGLCIASQHEVRSVLLVSRVPFADIRTLALDESSRTSAVLVQVLLAERFSVRPAAVPFRPDLEAMLATADAALLIGDPALRVDRSRYEVVDLAAEWRALTGLPFVFAVWAVTAAAAATELPRILTASLAAAEAEMPALIAAAAAHGGLAEVEVATYLTQHLSYHLGAAERASLDEFFRRAHRQGLLPAPRPIRFLAEGA
jgi:chorismate dehydratase